MRGTQSAIQNMVKQLGITPAYAGNTDIKYVKSAVDGDHPRVCGEHLESLGCFAVVVGSPPRMRGTPLPI